MMATGEQDNSTETTGSRHHLLPLQGQLGPSDLPDERGLEVDFNFTGEMTEWDSFDAILKEFKSSLYTYNQPSTIVLLCVYVPIFMLSLGGNTMVFLIIVGNKNMRSVTNYFLLNLAIADLLVTVACIPLTVGETVYRVWVYGEFLCKASGYLQGVSIAASVLTIMALSLDRYAAIRHPVKSRRLSTKSHVKIAIVLIWLLSCGIMLPLAIIRALQDEMITVDVHFSYCHEKWSSAQARRLFDIFIFVFFYIIPGLVIIISYSTTGCHLLASEEALQRQDSDVYQRHKIMAGRRRVARMLLILAILFAVSWMPYHAVNLYMNFSSKREAGNSLMTLSFALLLGHSHSAQNPILYCFTNSSFKRGMIGLLRCQKTSLSDFTRASTRGDRRYHPAVGRSERSKETRRGVLYRTSLQSGASGCLVESNPMTLGPSHLGRSRSCTYGRGRCNLSSDDEDNCSQEALPLMSLSIKQQSKESQELPGDSSAKSFSDKNNTTCLIGSAILNESSTSLPDRSQICVNIYSVNNDDNWDINSVALVHNQITQKGTSCNCVLLNKGAEDSDLLMSTCNCQQNIEHSEDIEADTFQKK